MSFCIGAAATLHIALLVAPIAAPTPVSSASADTLSSVFWDAEPLDPAAGPAHLAPTSASEGSQRDQAEAAPKVPATSAPTSRSRSPRPRSVASPDASTVAERLAADVGRPSSTHAPRLADPAPSGAFHADPSRLLGWRGHSMWRGFRVRGRGAGMDAGAGVGRDASVAHGPRLRSEHPCRGLFPYAAGSDRGTATVSVDVTGDGSPAHPRIVTEQPMGQGFAAAALACAARLRFEPAVDAHGVPIASTSVVRLRFTRDW